MFDIFVTSIQSDRMCFNISADYNVGNLCSFFADCVNLHLMLELTIKNGSHVTHVEGKNFTEIVVEIPDICLTCEDKINITAIVVPSLLVIFAVVCIVAVIFILCRRKYRKNKKKK